MQTKEKCQQLLRSENINPLSSIHYDVNGSSHELSVAKIIESYMQASIEAQALFYETFKRSCEEKKVKEFFEKMGELLLLSTLSNNFPS